jgi:hypothetical protein
MLDRVLSRLGFASGGGDRRLSRLSLVNATAVTAGAQSVTEDVSTSFQDNLQGRVISLELLVRGLLVESLLKSERPVQAAQEMRRGLFASLQHVERAFDEDADRVWAAVVATLNSSFDVVEARLKSVLESDANVNLDANVRRELERLVIHLAELRGHALGAQIAASMSLHHIIATSDNPKSDLSELRAFALDAVRALAEEDPPSAATKNEARQRLEETFQVVAAMSQIPIEDESQD